MKRHVSKKKHSWGLYQLNSTFFSLPTFKIQGDVDEESELSKYYYLIILLMSRNAHIE